MGLEQKDVLYLFWKTCIGGPVVLIFCIGRFWPLLSHFHQDKHRPFPPPILRFSLPLLLLRYSKNLPRKEPKQSFLSAEPLVPSPVSAPVPSGVMTPYAFSPSLSLSYSAPGGPALPGSPCSPVHISCVRVSRLGRAVEDVGGACVLRRGRGAGAAGWGVRPDGPASACAGGRAWRRGLRGLGREVREGRGLRRRKACDQAGEVGFVGGCVLAAS